MDNTTKTKHRSSAIFTIICGLALYLHAGSGGAAMGKEQAENQAKGLSNGATATTPKTIMESLIKEMHGSPKLERVNEVVDTYFDTGQMGRVALGKYIKVISGDEKKEYLENFDLFFKKVLLALAVEYKNAEFDTVQESVQGGEASIKTKVHASNGNPIPLSISLSLKDGTQWKVNDVVIESISLVTSYRGQFGSTFKNGGMPKLNEFLKR